MNKIHILDGATGTELLKHGYDGKDQAQWILSHPDVFDRLQEDYVNAGSEILYTPTFVCSRPHLALCKAADQVEEYNKKMFALAKKHGTEVFGDLGPTGLFSGAFGETPEAEIYDIYKEQASVLENCGVDAFIIETMMTREDALNAVRAVKDISEKPVLLSLSCDKNGRIMSGDDVIDILKEAEALGIAAFGLNCSAGPKEMLEQIKRIHKYTNLPLLAKPNAGLPVVRGGKTYYDCSPEEFAFYAPLFVENGVRYIGGCCGTTPEHIRKLKDILEK